MLPRRLFIACVLSLALLGASFAAFASSATGILVAWQDAADAEFLVLPASQQQPEIYFAGRLLHSTPKYEVWRYPVPERSQRLQLLQLLQANPQVRFAELDTQVSPQTSVQQLPKQFSLLKLADSAQQPRQFACANAPIAILDTGIDSSHQALATSTNFVAQKNFTRATNTQDAVGHGTHLAGLIAAKPSDLYDQQTNEYVASIAGICSSASLYNFKVLASAKNGNISDVYAGLIEAAKYSWPDLPIINLSLAANYSPLIEDALLDLNAAGKLIVTAAGNSHTNMDARPGYPAAYSANLEHLLSIANLESAQALAPTSNYGYLTADFAAPGQQLFSTWKNNSYEEESGTSMAAPLVSATLAALIDLHSSENLPPIAYRAALINSLQRQQEFAGQLRFAGYVNAGAALDAAAADLFKPTWVNFSWAVGEPALYLQGFKLSAVTEVRFIAKNSNLKLTTQFLPETQKLRVELPTNWREGRLQIQAKHLGQNLNLESLDFQLMHQQSLPANASSCSQKSCNLGDYSLHFSLKDGVAENAWQVSSSSKNGQQKILLKGSDLSGVWQLSLSGRPRLKFSQLQVEHPALGTLTPLKQEDGFTLNADSSQASWVLSQPQKWGQTVAGQQQIILVPEVKILEAEEGGFGSSSSRCYLATVAYGDAFAPEVVKLRYFRDAYLQENFLGQQFISFYYWISPSLSQWLEDKPRLQKWLRWWLDVLVSWLPEAEAETMPQQLES